MLGFFQSACLMPFLCLTSVFERHIFDLFLVCILEVCFFCNLIIFVLSSSNCVMDIMLGFSQSRCLLPFVCVTSFFACHVFDLLLECNLEVQALSDKKKEPLQEEFFSNLVIDIVLEFLSSKC